MALTTLQQPDTRAFFGQPMKFRFSSDLFPTPTASTSRSINAVSTVNGFLVIGVPLAATELVLGGYVYLQYGAESWVAKILAVNIGADRELTLNIQNPGLLVGVATAKLYYFNYAIELRLKIGQPTGTADRTIVITSTALEIDIAPTLKKYWERYFMAYAANQVDEDQLTYVWSTREIYTGSATSFATDSAAKVALPGSLIPQQSFPVMLTNRPIYSEAVTGQVIPFSAFGELAAQYFKQTFGAYSLTVTTANDIQSVGANFTIPQVQSTYALYLDSTDALISSLFTINSRCRTDKDIELVWRNSTGRFDSHCFKLIRSSKQTNKDGLYRSGNDLAAVQAGDAGNFERNYFTVDSEISWQLTSGVVGEVVAEWLSGVADSDEVYYRDGLKYYRILVGDGNIITKQSGIQYPTVDIIVFGSQNNALQLPRPFNEAVANDTIEIYTDYLTANGFTSDSPTCFASFITDAQNIAA